MIFNHEATTGAETSISAKPSINEHFPSVLKKTAGINPTTHQSSGDTGTAPLQEERRLGTIEFGYYKNSVATEQSRTITLEDLIDGIRSDEYAERVNQIRELLADGKKDEASALKKTLPAISVSGVVSEGGRARAAAEGRFSHSGLIQIDLDGKDNPSWSVAEMVTLLKADSYIQAGFITPSGAGVKGFARIPANIDTHKAAFLGLEAHFANLGLVIDPSCKDLVRLCFVSRDPEAWLRPEPALIFPVVAPKPALKTSAMAVSSRWSGSGSLARIKQRDLTRAEVDAMLAVIPTRPDYPEWLRVMSAVWDVLGEVEGTAALKNWSPEEIPREYAAKYPQRLTDVKAGTLVWMAREHGWVGPQTALAVSIETFSPKAIITAPLLVDLTCYDSSDAGNAERVSAVAEGNIHFVTNTGQWLLWNGCRWLPDRDGQMTRLFLKVMETTVQQAMQMPNRAAGDAIVKYALKCRDQAKITTGISMLKSVVGVSISAAALDANPWVIGTPNGLIDLRTGSAINPDKSYLVTKSIGCDDEPTATCPLWEEFIATVTGGDSELPRYLQAVVGYGLTAEVREQCLFFFYGLGENGKGVFTETIKSLLGNYAMTAPESLFTTDRNTSATNDIARLVGCRLATASELDEGASFAESRLKSLTGGDTITARFLHREFFDFQPTHKFWISGNHKPYVRGADDGIWRRLRLIPFTVKIPAEKKDSRLAEKLRAELPGILRWALEGSLIWQNEGLTTPQCVIAATAEYRAQEDLVGQFMEDRILTREDERALQSTVYESYQDWALGMGIAKPWSATALNRKLSDRGIEKVKITGARQWRGITTV